MDKLAEEYSKLKTDFERDLNMKNEEKRKASEESASTVGKNTENLLSMETLVKYLNDNKTILKENMNEDDRKRLQNVLDLSKDIKSLCKEAIDTLKLDLMAFYNMSKNKFSAAINEITNITSFGDNSK